MSDLFGGAKPEDITDTQKLAAVNRELVFRRRVYARRVDQGKMTQELADRQILIFEAIRADYAARIAAL